MQKESEKLPLLVHVVCMCCSHYKGKLKFGFKLEGDDGEGLVAAEFHFCLRNV